MASWDALLERLAETPRENGSAELHRAATFLYDELTATGADVTLEPFTATPYALRLAGVLALAGGLLYLRCMRRGRHAAALLVVLALGGVLVAELELRVPVFGWIGAETQHHVVARLPGERGQRLLLLSAHYDTKTDLLDHVQRAPVDLLAAPLLALALLGGLAAAAAPRAGRAAPALRALGRVAGWAGAGFGALAFLAFSAGAFAPGRSPGALDDGGSCAVLVRLAERLAAEPLAHTDVEIALFSAEEVGVQGSAVYARRRFASPPQHPTFAVNLEGLGASAQHAVLPRERSLLRSFAPDPRLVARLDAVHRERFGSPLEALPAGGSTDAGSLLARGVPAVTLTSREPGAAVPRGLHSVRDDRSRLDPDALDASLDYLLAVARAVDAGGP